MCPKMSGGERRVGRPSSKASPQPRKNWIKKRKKKVKPIMPRVPWFHGNCPALASVLTKMVVGIAKIKGSVGKWIEK